MRKMYSEKQLVGVVNKAIDDGEIEVGGLPEIASGDAGKVLTVNSGETGVEWAESAGGLPTIESGDAGKLLAVNAGETGAEWVSDNSLQLPASAPASQQLVGINTSGEQNALSIGAGLSIENNSLKTNVLEIDWQSSTTSYREISEEVYNNITNGVYDEIIIKNTYYQSTGYGTVHYIRRSFSRNNYASLGDLSSTTVNGAGTGTIKFSYLYLTIGASSSLAPNTGYYLSLDKSENTATIFQVYD